MSESSMTTEEVVEIYYDAPGMQSITMAGTFERWLAHHDSQVAAQALRGAVRYARPDAGDHVGMTRSEAEAFEDALTLVEEYAAHLLGEGPQ